jgi:hypothetical protein
MSMWQTFYSIEPSCWQQVTPQGSQHSIWKLDSGFTSQYYPGVYDSILRDGDPFQNTWTVCRFNQPAPAGAFELFVRSLRTNSAEYYHIPVPSILPFLVSPREIPRNDSNQGLQTGKARLQTTFGTMRIIAPEIDEDMTIDLGTLKITLAESKQEKQNRLAPWTRMLWWYGRIQELDIQAFTQLKAPIQNYLRGPRYSEAASALTEAQLKEWQNQALIPHELAWLWQNDMPEEVMKLETVLAMVNDPMRQANSAYMPVIPNLVRYLIPSKLALIDMQVLMTIGAVRERWRYKAREWYKLLQRKPALKALAESPNGKQLAAQDPEWIAITNHPLSRQEDDDDLEAHMHSKGDFGPSYQERLRQSDAQMNVLMGGMFAQNEQMTRWMGGMGIPVGQPIPMPNFSNPLMQQVPTPAWKIYRPYMM